MTPLQANAPALGAYIEPATVPFTFGAPGWRVAAAAIVVLLLVAVWLWLRRRARNRYRRHALQMLAALAPGEVVYEANVLMKRICMMLYPREACAGLRGREWFAFLNAAVRTPLFGEEDVRLTENLYNTGPEIKTEATAPAGTDESAARAFAVRTEKWIKRHRYVARNTR